jgi:hypothetical protein
MNDPGDGDGALNTSETVIQLARDGLRTRQIGESQSGDVYWPGVLDLARTHRLVPLIAAALRRGHTCVPREVADAIWDEARRMTVGGLMIEHTLRQLIATLSASAVEVLVLKGPVLAYGLYPRPALRPYGDIDLLCRPQDYGRLAQILKSAAYVGDDKAMTLGRKRTEIEGHDERTFLSPISNVRVEVHTSLLEYGLVERHYDDFWREAVSVKVAGIGLRALAPEHQILHLVTHAHRHSYEQWIMLLDLDLLIRRHLTSLDWRSIMGVARDEGVGPVLRHVVDLLHVLLGTPRASIGPPTLDEMLLRPMYHRLWPPGRVRQLTMTRHLRRVRFEPMTGHPLDVLPGLLLLGRRREKLRALQELVWSRQSSIYANN